MSPCHRYLAALSGLVLALGGHAQRGLSYYLEQAVAHSPAVIDAGNQAEAARLNGEQLQASVSKPVVSVTGGYLLAPYFTPNGVQWNTNDPRPNAVGYDIAVSNGGLYSAMAGVQQPLFSHARQQAYGEQAAALMQAALNNRELARHEVERIVTDQYVQCTLDGEQVANMERLLQVVSAQERTVGALVEAGVMKRSDLLLIGIERRGREAELERVKATYRRDLFELNALCGIADTAVVRLVPPALTPRTTDGPSPFLEKFRYDSLAFDASRRVFEIKYKPQTNAFANTGLNAVVLEDIGRKVGMSAGLNFSLILSDGGQRKLVRDRAAILQRSAQAGRDMLRDQQAVRRRNALQDIVAAQERTRTLAAQLADYERLIELYQTQLAQGQLSVIDLVAALKLYTTAQGDLALARNAEQRAINLYNYWNW
jgi:outer membrane protein TolC